MMYNGVFERSRSGLRASTPVLNRNVWSSMLRWFLFGHVPTGQFKQCASGPTKRNKMLIVTQSPQDDLKNENGWPHTGANCMPESHTPPTLRSNITLKFRVIIITSWSRCSDARESGKSQVRCSGAR